jgi:two-component system response regulator MprA
MTGATIGLCEDDDDLRGIIRDALQREGMVVRPTASGAEAILAFSRAPADVLILDILLPDADGRDVCQALRARGVTTPVLFLTARTAVPDRLSGFHAGGDDYLTKPFALAELFLRVRALLRRGTPAADVADADGLVLDPTRHAVLHGGNTETLTPTEFRLLAALAAGPGEVVRHPALVAAGWPEGAIVHDNTLHVYIARLRRKLRRVDAPARIDTVRGVGYRLQ